MVMNCWEFLKCGREPGGPKAAEMGVCPAATATRLDACNQGKNGGRLCWLIHATLCGNQVQGDLYSKLGNCSKCEFFKKVHQEEGTNFDFGMKYADG
jgi:hypothetical protein